MDAVEKLSLSIVMFALCCFCQTIPANRIFNKGARYAPAEELPKPGLANPGDYVPRRN